MLARPEDQEVDIFIAVEPGEICVFGEVEVVGNVAVSEEDILQRVTILPGERYDPDAMNETQRNLFGQGTFAVVQVIPQFEVPGQQIPIRIEVTEANFREVKIGGGAATGGSQGEVRGRIAAEHRNLFGRLIRVDIDATAGQRVYSTNSAPGLSALAAARNQDLSEVAGTVSTGPFAQVDADLVWPEFLGIRRLSHTPETSYELAFEQLQTYHDVSLAPAFTWRPMPKLAITPIYRWEYRFFMERDPSVFSPTLDEVERGLNDWSVQSFQLRANWNTAQPFFQPTHGWYVDVSVLNAGGPLEGFTWAQGDLDIRKYQAVAVNDFRGVLAFRVAGGYQRAYGDDGHVPSWKRYRLGGATDVRGYAQDYLGPRACFAQHPKTGLPATLDADGSVVTDADGNPVAPQSIPCSSIDRRERVVYPLGGTLSALGSVELRIELPYNMQAVVFHDLGQVWPDPRYWSLRELSPTAGVGLRYPTPAGPARLDLGVRYLHWTDREPAYAADRFFGVYIAVGEAF